MIISSRSLSSTRTFMALHTATTSSLLIVPDLVGREENKFYQWPQSQAPFHQLQCTQEAGREESSASTQLPPSTQQYIQLHASHVILQVFVILQESLPQVDVQGVSGVHVPAQRKTTYTTNIATGLTCLTPKLQFHLQYVY